MKFPKSMHAEGFYDHIDTTLSQGVKPGLKPAFGAGAKPHTSTHPLRREDPIAMTPADRSTATAVPPVMRPVVPEAAPVRRAAGTPWVVGAGVGIVLVGLAVVTSRNLSGPEPATSPAVVVGQASPAPEDAQLQSAPPGAGPEAAASEPVTAPPAIAEPSAAVAKAPAPKSESPLPVERAAPAPVARTLAPAPEVLAQVSPPAQLREPALQPLAPPVVTPPVVTPAPAVVPPEATPVIPPVAQQTPPATPEPEDGGITVKVRQALAADATLSAVPIAVSTEHGVVKLEGQAPDAQVRERATVVAASTAGVKGVDNRLTLPPMAALDRSAGIGG